MWTTLQLPTCIHKLFQRLARKSPIDLEVLYRLQPKVSDAELDEEKANDNYVPGEDDDNDDNNNDDDGGRDNNVDHHVDTDDSEDAAIILNPTGNDHAGPITGVTMYQDQTIVNTDAAGKETVDINTTSESGATKPTGVSEPTWVTDPTEEDRKEEYDNDANGTKHH